MTRLVDIPTTAVPPAETRPSEIVARIRSYRPSRRAVVRGLVIAVTASALVPIDWWLTRRAAAAAPADGSTEGDRSEFPTCQPADYAEEDNNWFTGGPAVCYGGWRRGSFPCSDGYHREGSFSDADSGESYTSTRLTTDCHGRNAWRWHGYRCSDAMTTTTFSDGSDYTALTIAACTLPEGDTGATSEPTTSAAPPQPAATSEPPPVAVASSTQPDPTSSTQPSPVTAAPRGNGPLGALLG